MECHVPLSEIQNRDQPRIHNCSHMRLSYHKAEALLSKFEQTNKCIFLPKPFFSLTTFSFLYILTFANSLKDLNFQP